MTLRPYQQQAIDRLAGAVSSGSRSPCLVLPTGTGKTRTVLSYLEQHAPRASVVWLSPRKALIDQTWAEAGRVMSDRMRLRVLTVQSVLEMVEPPPADICVVDEAHYFYGTKEWSRVAKAYPNRIAATATPSRADGAALGELADCIVEGPQRRELAKLGFLPKIRTVGPDAKRSVAAWSPLDAFQKFTPGQRCIVFCSSIAQARTVAKDFQAAGVPAGSMTMEDGMADLQLHRSGRLSVLTNVYMVAVGYDDPTVTSVIVARSCNSATAYIQMCGRARGAGAPRVTILDLFGNFHEWGFADEDRKFSLTGKAIRPAKEGIIATCVCGSSYRSSPFITVCAHCSASLPKHKTKEDVKRAVIAAKCEGNRVADTMPTKKAFFQKMIFIMKARGQPLGIAVSVYRKRYGVNPPLEWRSAYGA